MINMDLPLRFSAPFSLLLAKTTAASKPAVTSLFMGWQKVAIYEPLVKFNVGSGLQ